MPLSSTVHSPSPVNVKGTPSRKPQGWWYPWLFVAGMLIVIAVNTVLAVVAVKTFPGSTTEDAYRRGLQYNQTIAAAEAQDARGWRFDLTISPDRTGGSVTGTDATPSGPAEALSVAVRFTDRAGQPLSRLDARALLVRPLGDSRETTVSLEEKGGGLYQGTVATPLTGGQWDVHILARRGDETFQQTRRIVLR